MPIEIIINMIIYATDDALLIKRELHIYFSNIFAIVCLVILIMVWQFESREIVPNCIINYLENHFIQMLEVSYANFCIRN